LELAEREATLQLQKAEAVGMAVRTARVELRRLAGLHRPAEAQAGAAAGAAAKAQQVRGAGAAGVEVGAAACRRVLCVLQLQRPPASCCSLAHALPSYLCSRQDTTAAAAQKRTGWLPRVGQTVLVPRLGKRAKVVAVDAASGALTLQAGMIKVTAAADEVQQ
jgi:hypothetical protein